MKRFGRQSRSTALRAFLLAAGWLCVPAAGAASWCAGNATELKAGLALGFLQQSDYTIKVVQGTHVLDEDLDYTLSAPTTIEGGYTAACAGRTVNAANTTIDMKGFDLLLDQPAGSPVASLSIDGVTIKSLGELDLEVGTHHQFAANDPGNLRLSRTRLSGDPASTTWFQLRHLGPGGITLENVVLDHLPAGSASGCAMVLSAHLEKTYVTLNAVSADLSGGADLCFGWADDASKIDIYNSIIWPSDGTNASIRTQDADHVVNLWNTIYAFKGGPGKFNENESVVQDPQWVNPAAGDYRLANNASPAVDSGTPIVPGGVPATDIEGNARWTGGEPDRGAYELKVSNAASYVVTTTADTTGAGTLRTAITQANANPNHSVITFAIPGACPQTIALTSILPRITTPILIDGTTQSGSRANTHPDAFNAKLCVIVKPATGMLALGFSVDQGATQASLMLRGLGIGGFNQPVRLLGGSNHVIAGNQFAGFLGGAVLSGASFNAVTMGVNASGSVIVGGSNTADRNVIGGAALSGVNVQSDMESTPDQCQIVNNLIGLSPSGNTAAPNFTGITLGGSGCSVLRNRIAGNKYDAIYVTSGSDHVIQENSIGFNASGVGFANQGHGVRIAGDYNTVGAANGSVVGGNTIRFMSKGVSVVDGTNNSIRGNIAYENSGMSIDLGDDGPSPNDAIDADAGPNNLQNSPQLVSLYFNTGSATKMTAVAQLDAASGTHRIDAYFIRGCDGGASTAMVFGSTALVAAGAIFTMPLNFPSGYGYLSLTSTDAYGNTSEFGNCYAIANAGNGPPPQSIIITSIPPNPGIVGTVYTLAAKATSNLPLALSVAAGSSSVCKISGWNVSFLAAGSCVIHLNQGGGPTHAPAPEVTHSIQVALPTLPAQTIAFTSVPPNPALVGQTYTPKATATSGLPVTFTIDASSASSCTIAGSVVTFVDTQALCIIYANQAGGTTHSPAKQVQQGFHVFSPDDFIFANGFEN